MTIEISIYLHNKTSCEAAATYAKKSILIAIARPACNIKTTIRNDLKILVSVASVALNIGYLPRHRVSPHTQIDYILKVSTPEELITHKLRKRKRAERPKPTPTKM